MEREKNEKKRKSTIYKKENKKDTRVVNIVFANNEPLKLEEILLNFVSPTIKI